MNDTLDQPGKVRERDAFDLEALRGHLSLRAPELPKVLEVKQFGRGYSNLTYGLTTEGGKDLVLRRAPPGVQIKSAHDMGREYRILSSLGPHWNKVPKTRYICEDSSVIGSPFYLMDRVEGVILRGKWPAALDTSPSAMQRASHAAIDTLAEIHKIDLQATGLHALGKPEGYITRQVRGWGGRYLAAKTDDVADVDTLVRWLESHMPGESGGTLIHNDYKYDNMVLSPGLDSVRAVLDWEMATVGDPLMDLGTALGYWVQADDPDLFQVLRFGPTHLPGSLTRIEIVERYIKMSGRKVDDPLYYFVFALFKLAVVAQQLYKRYAEGLTEEPRYALMIEGVKSVARMAVIAMERGTIGP